MITTSVAPVTTDIQFRHKYSKHGKTSYNIKSTNLEIDNSEDSEGEEIIEYANEEGIFIQEQANEESFIRKHEIPRKTFHSFTGIFTLWLYVNGYNQRQLVFPMLIMAITCFFQDFIRFRVPSVNDKLIKLYSSMMREARKRLQRNSFLPNWNNYHFFVIAEGYMFNVQFIIKLG